MTRKDFELIACVFKLACQRMRFEPDGDLAFMHRVLAEDLADELRSTNPCFDRERFLAACGVSQPAAAPDFIPGEQPEPRDSYGTLTRSCR